MTKQIMIIGLGQFGMALAQTLTERGVEVMAVDISQEKIDIVSSFVAHAVVMDATDETALAKLHPEQRDSVICAMGAAAKESVIICTALLRQLGCNHIVARAVSATYRRILFMVGAHEVIIPEQDYGRRFATHLLYRNMLAESDSANELNLTEIKLPPFMIGKTLVELSLPKNYGIIVAAIRHNGVLSRPDPGRKLEENDMLLIVSDENAIEKLFREV